MAKSKRIANGWYKLRWQILERDNFTCQYCGRAAPDVMLEVDHRTALSEGGTDDPDNLIASCMACNRGKSGLRQSMLLAKARALARADRVTNSQKIVNALEHGALTVKQIALIINRNDKKQSTTRVVLTRLKHRGKVLNLGNGKWGLTAQ